MILTANIIDDVIKEISAVEYLSFDTETNSLDKRILFMVGFSFAYKINNEYKSYYVPLKHVYGDNFSDYNSLKKLWQVIKTKKLIMHSATFDKAVMKKYDVDLPIHTDTLIQAWLINENRQLKLKSLVPSTLGFSMLNYDEVAGKESFEFVPVDLAAQYASDDALYTLQLFHFQEKQYKAEELSLNILYKLEIPLIDIVVFMEEHGVRIDKDKLQEKTELCENKLNESVKLIYQEAGREFNINSTQQLGYILFDEMKLTPPKKTTKGAISCDASVLEILAKKKVKLAQYVLDYRLYYGMLSKFIPSMYPEKGNHIYPSFNSVGTVSGRFSSSKPNFQNIPSTKDILHLRECIIPEEGHILLVVDYSQLELRILAHYSKDPILTEAYKKKEDIHQKTADLLSITRSQGKIMNFALIYGMGTKKLAGDLKVSQKKAQEIYDNYFKEYSVIVKFKEKVEAIVTQTGFVRTLLGRKRRLPGVKSKDYEKRSYALRQAVNIKIQGTGADLMKLAMIQLFPEIIRTGSYLFNQIHDELIISVPKECVHEMYYIVKEKMETAFSINNVEFNIPIVADVNIGYNWEQGKKGNISLEEYLNSQEVPK